ncbi:MAG: hypothetical protein AAF532_13910 [Planctomycetota bacterium]
MLSVTFDFAADRERLDGLRDEITTGFPVLLERLGLSLISDVADAYQQKADGEVGVDGVKWDPLKESTLAARVRRVGPGRRQVQQRKRNRDRIADLEKSRVAVRGKTGEARQSARRANARIDRKIATIKKRVATSLEKTQGLIAQAVANHQIGVDRGLQRASIRPGFAADDGEGGTAFEVLDGSVVVGYAREYSDDFDKDRELIPDPLPELFEENLERTGQEWLDEITEAARGF